LQTSNGARQNNITYLLNTDGSSATTSQQIESMFNSYFTDIFQALDYPTIQQEINSAGIQPVFDQTQTHDANGDNDDFTYSIPTLQEIHNIIKGMKSHAGPGPDGLNAAFYKASWDWI
jgi:hypothetical protein